MASPDPDVLEQYFEIFELDVDATLGDLDEQYHHMTLELHKEKKFLSKQVEQRWDELDTVYYVLLQHFIRRDCEEGVSDQCMELGWDNIVQRRYEPGVGHFYKAYKTIPQPDPVDNVQLSTTSTLNRSKENTNSKSDESKSLVPETKSTKRGEHSALISQAPSIFKVVEVTGDVFDAPDGSVIVHAVNCLGVWGNGFALALRNRYPAAYQVYIKTCASFDPLQLAGYSLLIAPQRADYYRRGIFHARHWIACLFTSVGYGASRNPTENPGRDDEEVILVNTESALLHLRTRITMTDPRDLGPTGILNRLFSPKFNAGNFGVPWSSTRDLVEMCFAGHDSTWTVVSPPTSE